MPRIKIQRILGTDPSAEQRIAELQAKMSAQGDIVSPKSRQLTEAVFGEALSPAQVVERVCADVHKRGLEALLFYTEKFDRAKLDAESLRVSLDELEDAHALADPAFLDTLRRVRSNILYFQSGLVQNEAVMRMSDTHELRMRFKPMRRIGICVPGGAAAYPSTLLMTVCPAQAAGVKEIAVVMPPTKNGAYNRDLLATCHELGVTEVYRVGGAQAVAALAYGVQGLPAVDMIVGPGNIFVTLAKKHVFGQVAIDCLAGPSEIVVLADETANPEHVAADLLAQAEHDPATSILITWHGPLIDEVEQAIERQLESLPRADQARNSLESFGAFMLAEDAEQALTWTNLIGPEHLHIITAGASDLVAKIENAGAIFVGEFTPVALGDYVAGPSHVLPTGGTSRYTGGLSALDFLRRSSVIAFSKKGLEKMAPDVRLLANKEGLTAHAASVDIRLNNEDRGLRREDRKKPRTSHIA